MCCGTGCLAGGSMKVAEAFAREIDAQHVPAHLGVFVKRTGCHGFCQRGPLVVIQPGGILYTHVKPADVAEIVEQTVARDEQPAYWSVIHEFDKLTGAPLVLNTSFNVQGEPIVAAPDDAVRCFLGTGIDALALGDYLAVKP